MQSTTIPEEIEYLTLDKEVAKQIIFPGDGDKPPKGAAIASTHSPSFSSLLKNK
jgi:hypothetical protein